MADHAGNGHPAHDAAPPVVPAIRLTFPPGDVVIATEGPVTTAMIYLGAWFLEAVARETRQGVVAQQAFGGAIGDPAAFIDQLRRSGRV